MALRYSWPDLWKESTPWLSVYCPDGSVMSKSFLVVISNITFNEVCLQNVLIVFLLFSCWLPFFRWLLKIYCKNWLLYFEGMCPSPQRWFLVIPISILLTFTSLKVLMLKLYCHRISWKEGQCLEGRGAWWWFILPLECPASFCCWFIFFLDWPACVAFLLWSNCNDYFLCFWSNC